MALDVAGMELMEKHRSEVSDCFADAPWCHSVQLWLSSMVGHLGSAMSHSRADAQADRLLIVPRDGDSIAVGLLESVGAAVQLAHHVV
jgi:hypothetical protein